MSDMHGGKRQLFKWLGFETSAENPPRDIVINDLFKSELSQKLWMEWNIKIEKLYRVMFDPVDHTVTVQSLGLNVIDSDIEGVYSSAEELPDWMQQKLAALSMIKVDPPQRPVDGVGLRVDENSYWIEAG